jgi:phosphoglycolate phosphatase
VLEVVRAYAPPVNVRVAIFDFDGTLSLIRSGWVGIMLDLFAREIKLFDTSESDEQLRHRFEDVILRLTGKETIHQMQVLVEAVAARGGKPASAAEYKELFLSELLRVAETRLEELRSGAVSPERYLVPGSRALLEWLKNEGVALYLASGTDDSSVKEEAAALDIARYFGPHIYGARDDARGFTKAGLIQHLLAEGRYQASDLVAFGDGFVEINEVSKSSGLAIGVATDEPECLRVDERKRKHLIAAGANYIIPNYIELSELIDIMQPQAVAP